jgi:hypothetical protein
MPSGGLHAQDGCSAAHIMLSHFIHLGRRIIPILACIAVAILFLPQSIENGRVKWNPCDRVDLPVRSH